MYPRPCQMTPGSFRLIPGTSTLYDNRFRHLQKRHKESFLGLNAVFLPDANPVGVVYRSSLPATPLCTPLHEGPQFSERVLTERLCKTPSPWKCKFFEPHHSDVGLNALEDNWGDVALKGDCVNRVTNLSRYKIFAEHSKNKIEKRTDKDLGHIPHQSKCQTITKGSQLLSLSLNKRVFVGNISYRVSRKELWSHFSQFGKVLHCVIIQDHIKNRPKGYGFVTFSKPEEAERAKTAPKEQLYLDCRELRVFPAEEKWTTKLLKEAKITLSENLEESEDLQPLRASTSLTVSISCQNLNDLHDDILLKIFSYLELKDRIKIERVCKKWKVLLSRLWHTQKTLQFHNMFSIFTGTSLTNKVLRSILKKCGPELRRIDISTTSHQLDFQATEIIAQFFPNLEEVDLAKINLTNMSLKQMSKNCRNLKKVELQRCLTIGEKGVWWLFHHCKNLEYVDLSSNVKITGQCFHIAGSCLTTVVLNGCSKLSLGGFQKIATKCSKLKALYLNDCVGINDQALETLCENLQELKIFHVGGALTQLSAAGLGHIGKLGNLEQLSLSHNAAVDDVVIGAVTQGCQHLRCLDISGCNEGVTDLSLNFLSKSSQLKSLYINYCGKITDIGLTALATQENLEVLQVRGCPQLGDTGLTSVILLCHGLTSLDISGCFYVTNAVVQACLDAVRDRTSDVKLVVTVGGTSVVPETLCLDSPLLEVSQFNLCADHLRPDRADWIGQCHSDYEEELQDKHEEGADGYQVMDEFMDRSVYSDDL